MTADLRDPVATANSRKAYMEFGTCVTDLEQCLRSAIKAFAQYHAADAQVTREQWAKWFDGETPSQEYIDGFNAGIESILTSADTFLDEHRL